MEIVVFFALLILLLVLLLPVSALWLVFSLRQRLDRLEKSIHALQQEKIATTKVNTEKETASLIAPVTPSELVTPPSADFQIEEKQEITASVPPPLPLSAKEAVVLDKLKAMYETASPTVTHKTTVSSSSANQPDAITDFFKRIGQWFISGNVPAKVGMLVLLCGVAALLKYANDQGLFRLPIELRLSAISLVAIITLFFAWENKKIQRAFALTLQGGAIGILLLVIFAAYKRYELIPGSLAFILSAVLIAGLSVLAVLHYSLTLAVLGILAGFMAPIWLAKGSGNHIALFSWYALLNAGVFAMAWMRPWRALNLLGFSFTWTIGLFWGILQYNHDKLFSAQCFLLLFFIFYLVLPLLYARRAELDSNGQARIDGTLIFGTPLIAFSLQSGLLQQKPWPLALCALGLAILYLILAYGLYQRARRWQHLTQAYTILAAGFATLAVPLALSAKATAAMFALEGAALVWLGLSQQRRLAHCSGIILQLLAACSWLISLKEPIPETRYLLANSLYISGLLLALAGFIISWLYYQYKTLRPLAIIPYLWGLGWWLSIGLREIFAYNHFYVPISYTNQGSLWYFEFNAVLLLMGLSMWLAALAHRYLPRSYSVNRIDPISSLSFTALPATVLLCLIIAFVTAIIHYLIAHPCGDLFSINKSPENISCSSLNIPGVIIGGTWVWLLFAGLGAHSLYLLRKCENKFPSLSQFIWLMLWSVVWVLEAPGNQYGGWNNLWIALPWLVLIGVSLYRWSWLCWPLGFAFDSFRKRLQFISFFILGLWWIVHLFHAGESAPLPYIPLLNPLDLAQISVLLLLALYCRQANISLPLGLFIAAWLLISVINLRVIHYWGSLPWDKHLLGSGLAQTSLSVIWSLLGMAGWIIGSKRNVWNIWLGGALLMGLVLLKLLLVDRGNLGNLLGICAFIIYGLLCIVVGGLAPAPPRRSDQ